LLVAFHETLGYSLDWFWEQWVYKGGEPSYEVSFQSIKNSFGSAVSQFEVTQIQEQSNIVGLFKMPIWFEVHYTDGTMDKKQEWIENQHHTITIPNANNKTIDFVLFDPNNEVLKTVIFKKAFNELQSQALKATHMLDKLDAIIAMRDIDIEQKRDFLIQLFSKETYHANKSEIISQLAQDTNTNTIALLKKALNDADVLVRKSAIQNLKTIPTTLLPDVENLLKDQSYDIIASTLEKLYINNPAAITQYLESTKSVEGTRGKNVKIKWLEIASASMGDKKYTDELVNYTSISYEFLTRNAAMVALKRLNYFDSEMLKNLVNALFNPNTKLATTAGETVQYFYAQNAYKKMIAEYSRSKNWEKWEKDLLDKYINY